MRSVFKVLGVTGAALAAGMVLAPAASAGTGPVEVEYQGCRFIAETWAQGAAPDGYAKQWFAKSNNHGEQSSKCWANIKVDYNVKGGPPNAFQYTHDGASPHELYLVQQGGAELDVSRLSVMVCRGEDNCTGWITN